MAKVAIADRRVRVFGGAMGRIVVIGECMVELKQTTAAADEGVAVVQSFGGDTLNTAVYVQRLAAALGTVTEYVTAIGDDPFSKNRGDFRVSAGATNYCRWRAAGYGNLRRALFVWLRDE